MRELVEDCLAITPAILKRLIVDGRDDIHLWTDEEDGETCLFAGFRGCEPQKIRIKECYFPILDRVYFRCGCGRPVYKLYLPPNGTHFSCRKCHRLRYQLETFDKHSIHGRVRYYDIRADKLSRHRATIRTPLYMGQYTKRYRRFLKMAGRAGLNRTVRDAIQVAERLQEKSRGYLEESRGF